MKKLILITLMYLVFTGYGVTQSNLYSSRNATFQMSGRYMEKLLVGQSNDLSVSLDYETTEMNLRINLNTIDFNIDSISTKFNLENTEVTFIGELSLDFINTKSHPPQKFTVKGWLESDNNKHIINSDGELYHINDSGDFVCMLTLTTKLNLKTLGINIPPGLHEEIQVSITQALLEHRKN